MTTNPYAPPKAAVADLGLPPSGLKRRSVLLMILFTIVTFGLYYIIWFFRRRTALNALNSPRKLPLWPLLSLTALTVAYFVLALMAGETPIETAYDAPVLGVLALARLAVGIVMIIQCFNIKGMIEDHAAPPIDTTAPALFAERVELSGLATFFFSIFYLQYAINKYIVDPRS